MERKTTRAWRRIQQKRIWHNRLRHIYYSFGCLTDTFHRYESWKSLKEMKWSHIYKNTGRPCSCIFCKRERYNRIDYKQETKRILFEEFKS